MAIDNKVGKVLGVIGGVGAIWTSGNFLTVFDQMTANSLSGAGPSDSTIEIGQSTTENPDMSPGTTVVTTAIGSSEISSSEPEALLIIFNKDAVPYTKVEGRARKLFNSLHTSNVNCGKQVAILTNSGRNYSLLEKLLYDKNFALTKDNLKVLERILNNLE